MKIQVRLIALSIIPIFILGFSGCTTVSKIKVQPPTKRPALFGPNSQRKTAQSKTSRVKPSQMERPASISKLQNKLIEGAYKLVGVRNIIVRGRHFNFDCTGTVLAIYYYAGIDLTKEFSRYTGNGVLRLYKIMKAHNLLYMTKHPSSGDLIFWDNTYDRNKDGKRNDYLTHVGMVVKVFKNGTIEYIHEHIRKGIVIERMNLNDPNTYSKKSNGKIIIVNAPIRIRSANSSHPPNWLASQLLKDFGMAYRLIED